MLVCVCGCVSRWSYRDRNLASVYLGDAIRDKERVQAQAPPECDDEVGGFRMTRSNLEV